jgi:DNA polymerase-3 subunit gamma/tau
LHRLWQLLLKGYDEVRGAPDPLVAAQMAMLRVMHASELPDPGGLIKQLEALAARPAAAPANVAAGASAGPSAEISPAAIAAEWEALVSQVEQVSPLVGSSMRLSVRVAALAAGQLRFVLAPGIAGDPTADIRKALDAATGQSWRVERLADGLKAMPSLEEARAAARAAEDAAILEDPLVRAAFAAFPGAEILKDVPISDRDTKSWSRRA